MTFLVEGLVASGALALPRSGSGSFGDHRARTLFLPPPEENHMHPHMHLGAITEIRTCGELERSGQLRR